MNSDRLIDLEIELNVLNYLKNNNYIDSKVYNFVSNKILVEINKFN